MRRCLTIEIEALRITIGNVKEAIQLLTGATSNAEKLEGALAAAGATATELLGISAIQDNC